MVNKIKVKKNEYKYRYTKSEGYSYFRLSKKDHNRLFQQPSQKRSIFFNSKYCLKDDVIVMFLVPTLLNKICSTLLYPVGCLAEGVYNYKSVWQSLVVDVWKWKETGSFCVDTYKRKNSEKIFDEIVACAKLTDKE